MEESEGFDIVGNLLCNYGMTGEVLAHEIFCYLDFSSIQDSRLVSLPWNLFLSNNRKLWMEILRQTQPYIQFLNNQLSSVKRSSHPLDRSVSYQNFGNEMKKNWEEFFECIEIRAKNDTFSCQKMIEVFKKIQLVHSAVQDVVHDCPDYKVFQKEFIGRKQTEEIQLEIDRSHVRRYDQSVNWVSEIVTRSEFLKQSQEQSGSYPFSWGKVQYHRRMILHAIEEELFTFWELE